MNLETKTLNAVLSVTRADASLPDDHNRTVYRAAWNLYMAAASCTPSTARRRISTAWIAAGLPAAWGKRQ